MIKLNCKSIILKALFIQDMLYVLHQDYLYNLSLRLYISITNRNFKEKKRAWTFITIENIGDLKQYIYIISCFLKVNNKKIEKIVQVFFCILKTSLYRTKCPFHKSSRGKRQNYTSECNVKQQQQEKTPKQKTQERKNILLFLRGTPIN